MSSGGYVLPGGHELRYEGAMIGQNTIARALELAREGHCRSLDDIKRRLSAEGYEGIHEHLAGSLIKRQITQILKPS